MKYVITIIAILSSFIVVPNSGNSQTPKLYCNDIFICSDTSCNVLTDTSCIELRYVVDGRSWECRYITYYFINGTNDVAGTEEHDAVRRAFSTWFAVTNFDFIEVCNEEDADIRIMWAEGKHSDNINDGEFDGREGEIAHTFYPPPNVGELSGDIHFDDAEDWRVNGGHIDVETVALHEIGHSLGLRHSDVKESVMDSFYYGLRRELYADDIAGIRSIYGHREEPIIGPSTICGDMAKYSLDDFDCLREKFNVVWSVSDNFTIESGQGTGNITVSTTADQEAGFIQVSIYSDCDELVFTKNVWIGKPEIPEIIMPECFRPGTNVSIRVTSDGATTYTWSFPDCPDGIPSTDPDPDCWYNYDGDGPDKVIHVYVGQQCSGSISVWASNECGTVSRNFPIECCDGDGPEGPDGPGGGPIMKLVFGNDGGVLQYMNVYPNPTDGILTVELFSEYFDELEEKIVLISTIDNDPVFHESFYSNRFDLDLRDLESGQYIFTISTARYILGTIIIVAK